MLCPDAPWIQYLAATLEEATRGVKEKLRKNQHSWTRTSCGNIDAYNISAMRVIIKAANTRELVFAGGMQCRASTQRAIEIGFEIFDVFDANRNANESRRHAEFRAVAFGNAAVRHRRGMADQTFDAA